MRIITGAMRSTPIAAMEEVTGIQPLQKRRDLKIVLQTEKFKCQHSHPMNKRLQKPNQKRIQRDSFVSQAKKLEATHNHLPKNPTPPDLYSFKPWEETSCSGIKIYTKIPQLHPGDTQADIVKRNITIDHCEERYPPEAWVHAYTDGSATKAVKNGGAGAFIKFPNGITSERSAPTGIHCSNYRAEVEALRMAVGMVKDDPSNNSDQVVFMTDALSVLEALVEGKEQKLMSCLKDLSLTHRVALQWIPAHCGIPGNEKADHLAKEGAKENQIEEDMTYHEKRTLIKSIFRNQPRKDDYLYLGREEQVIIFRLRTGHNRLSAHMHKKFKLTPTSACSCQQGDQTAEHVLQSCTKLEQERVDIWPTGTSLQTKLYGSREELMKTAQFIKSINLKV